MNLMPSLLYMFVAGLFIPIGGLLASISGLHQKWIGLEARHFIIALGAGVLLGAVTLVLVPEGNAAFGGSLWSAVIVFSGGITFFLFEKIIGHKRRNSPQAMGMLLDFVPESIALGSMIASNSGNFMLLAILIGLQNLPEGFNSYSELICSNRCNPKKTLWFMFALAFFGPLSGILGFYIFSDHQVLTGALMLFSSGGIFYLIFQDIAPQISLKNHWLPSLGTVFGYSIGLVSLNLLGE